MRLHRPSPALAVAFVALLVALGGAAVAAVPARDGDVHFCYSKRTGAVEVVDTQRDRFRCERNWRGFTVDSTPTELVSPDGRSRVRVADGGLAELTSPGGTVRVRNKQLTVDAPDELELTTGRASIVMRKDGSIVLNGTSVTIDGGGAVQLKSGGDVTVKGSKIGGN